MERGQGWTEIHESEYDKNVATFTIVSNHFVTYDQPFRGDSVSVALAARIVDLFPEASTVNFFRPTDRPEIFRWHWINIQGWKEWSAKNEGGISFLRINRILAPTVDIHPLEDDWFLVFIDNSGYRRQGHTRYYKCDQMTGLVNLFDHLYNKS
jgi:hypothetical protein